MSDANDGVKTPAPPFVTGAGEELTKNIKNKHNFKNFTSKYFAIYNICCDCWDEKNTILMIKY